MSVERGMATTKTTTNAGIDYSLGQSNFNTETGIHFGFISLNAICQAWCDDSEPVYGDPYCPHCEEEIDHESPEDLEECPNCNHEFDCGEDFYGENIGCEYMAEGMVMQSAFDGAEVCVMASPYYTHAQYCSPCAPGAGNLDSPCDDGPKTYCPGHDWFDGGSAPYAVYRVSNGERVWTQEENAANRDLALRARNGQVGSGMTFRG